MHEASAQFNSGTNKYVASCSECYFAVSTKRASEVAIACAEHERTKNTPTTQGLQDLLP